MGDIEAVRAAELTLDTTIDKMNMKADEKKSDSVNSSLFDSANSLNNQNPQSDQTANQSNANQTSV